MQVIENTITKVRNKNLPVTPDEAETQTEDEPGEVSHPHMSLPYGGDKGNTVLKKLKRVLDRTLPSTVKPEISVKGKKIGSRFKIKDKIDDKHTSGIIYEFNCNRTTCNSKYDGETGCRKEVRVEQHGGKDKASAIFHHCRAKKHAKAKEKNFTILATNYPQWRSRKICEAMFIRDRKPDLNKQGDKNRQSYKLHLFS